MQSFIGNAIYISQHELAIAAAVLKREKNLGAEVGEIANAIANALAEKLADIEHLYNNDSTLQRRIEKLELKAEQDLEYHRWTQSLNGRH